AFQRISARTMSADGSRVYFNDGFSGPIYLHADGVTKLVSRSHRDGDDQTVPAAGTSQVLSVSRDGRYVLFWKSLASGEGLTNEYTAANGTIALYRYDADTDDLKVIVAPPPGGGGTFTSSNSSDDMQRIYYMVSDVMAPGADPGVEHLYLWDHGTTKLVMNFA